VVEIRAATADDDAAVLELLQASMGWVPDDQYARFFTWKHRESPFGPSPAWVAVEGRRIVGFRTFLRWQFRAAGVAFVFNTPNDNSRPGYMKMGWKLVRRLPVAARPRSPQALVRLVRARTPADKWSTECPTGVAAPEALADTGDAALAPLLDEAASGGLRTHRTPAYLRWRYGFPPLRYRVLTAPGGPADGLVVFRLRRRGAATEAAVCEVLVPGGSVRTTRRLLGRMLQDSGADYAVILGPPRRRLGFLPVPGQGPTLVWRGVKDTAPPPPEAWNLALGDIELL
jgi:hypothetical protein